jgi:glycosidase
MADAKKFAHEKFTAALLAGRTPQDNSENVLSPETLPSLRTMSSPGRIRIYQLLPRLFGNCNETRRPNGPLAENGCGKFADLNDAALTSLRAMGFTHLWLTGVLRQATATDYSAHGLPADDPDLLKGLAGSPYAIKDCFDVCPDYAEQPAQRLEEFRALLARMHAHGLRAIIDFVPNHVARSYRSTIRPEQDFGARDVRDRFFDPRNNFFYLQLGDGPPLRLPTFADGQAISPTCQVLGGCDGRFDGELDHGKVTGNNAATWTPGLGDWYETVKLNYGYDFTTGAREYPAAERAHKPIPDTWHKMDTVLAHWQALGVDGFRCDMAHMVPPEFWAWAVARARERQPAVLFLAEAYDNDPMKVGRGNVMHDLLRAGFDAVYDDPAYKILKGIYDKSKWANDLDVVTADAFVFEHSLRYAENHDEVRLAGANQWGGIGPAVGRALSAILYGLSRGPVLLYSGQEVGEPAQGAEGFAGDNARTTIFDYWSMPELVKWVNVHRYDGARLSAEQKKLRAFYARLIALIGEPAFRDGGFFGLNAANNQNPHFGRLPGESASGHWLYAFLRHDPASSQRFLIVANLHRNETLRDVRVRLPAEALAFLRLDAQAPISIADRLADSPVATTLMPDAEGALMLNLPALPALTACYFELQAGSAA